MRFRRSQLLDVGVELVFHTIVVFSLYLLFAGHNRPGGGFIGGLVAGAALIVRFLAADRPGTGLGRVRAETIVAIGLVVAVMVAIVPLFTGGELLQSGLVELDLPLFGKVKAYSVLAFDVGVYAVVVGVVAAVLEALGVAADDAAARRHRAFPDGHDLDGETSEPTRPTR